jgi:hypothetical protein
MGDINTLFSNIDKEMFIIPFFLVQQFLLYKMVWKTKPFNKMCKHPLR